MKVDKLYEILYEFDWVVCKKTINLIFMSKDLRF